MSPDRLAKKLAKVSAAYKQPLTLDPRAVELAKHAIAYEQAFKIYFPSAAEDMAKFATELLLDAGVRFWISPHGDAIMCVRCRLTSRNPNDVKERYCGNCHEFLDEPQGGRAA